MLTMLRRASGRKVNIIEGVGDPDECPMLFADGHLAHKELGWKPKIGVEAAIKSALEARREN
jgi:prepilin-type processing-associated H-X9-DG protein